MFCIFSRGGCISWCNFCILVFLIETPLEYLKEVIILLTDLPFFPYGQALP